VHGVASDLLLGRFVVFQTPFEEESRKAEMVVDADCKNEGISLLNPKNMEILHYVDYH
jgi:hypothetical protein